MPSAPGYMPKYSSNERFSCTMNTACLILFMSAVVESARSTAFTDVCNGVACARLQLVAVTPAATSPIRDHRPTTDPSLEASMPARRYKRDDPRTIARTLHSDGGLMNGDVRCPSCG